jgi:mRNA-degrading endonuclease RelE of RelBE toxin-antitoxin system
MEFRIADTFTESLARLTGDEQKAVKTTAFDLQLNPANPGMSFHKIEKAKDKNFWSVRVSGDIRLIIHKTANSLLLCYVDHHDKAYAWAERRKLETHPTTGAAQLVELRETVQEIVIPRYVEAPIQERIETVGDDADLQEVYDTERHLLYVACTRARDHLLVTSVALASDCEPLRSPQRLILSVRHQESSCRVRSKKQIGSC